MATKGNTLNFRETTIKYVKDILRAKTISEVIYSELQDAHLRKLEAETAAEYAHAAMQFNEDRIARLKQRLLEHKENTWTKRRMSLIGKENLVFGQETKNLEISYKVKTGVEKPKPKSTQTKSVNLQSIQGLNLANDS